VFDDPHSVSLETPDRIVRGRLRRRPVAIGELGKYLEKLGIVSNIKAVKLSDYHSGIKVKDSVSRIESNLADVGFGVSQVIPVLQGCLDRSSAPLFIEQPEIHLHPKAQSELAELICETSLHRQVVVETHSEHMINRARILVARGAIAPENVSILYVDREKSGSCITRIGLTKAGEFTRDWPSGFFDERYRDSLELLEINSGQ